jgi:hypothetical protein
MIKSTEEDKEAFNLDLNYEPKSLKSSKIFNENFENIKNDYFNHKHSQTENNILNFANEGTQTDEIINNDLIVLKNDYIRRTKALVIIFLTILCILIYLFPVDPIKLTKNSQDLQIFSNLSDCEVKKPETLITECIYSQSPINPEKSIQLKENISSTTEKQKFTEINYLSKEECERFEEYPDTLEKLNYLETKINWKPSNEGKNLTLIDIISYKNCEFFIGYSNTQILKFTLYQDFSKSLYFSNIDQVIISPNKEFIALSENFRGFSIIRTSDFKSFTLDSSLKLFESRPMMDFSPDSSYLFYTRENQLKISVFSTQDAKNYLELDTKNEKTIQIKATKTLYHLIVKTENIPLKIYSIFSPNYLHLVPNEETLKKLENDFPELSDLFK